MKPSVFLLLLLLLFPSSKAICEQKDCLGCLSTSCFLCIGDYGSICVPGEWNCPNATTIIFGPGQTDHCPTTTTPPAPTTEPPPTMTYFAYFGIVATAIVGGVLLLLLIFTAYYVIKYIRNQKQQQEYQQIMERSVSPSDQENIPLEQLHQAESLGQIQTSRGPHSYANPNYGEEEDEEEDLFARSEGPIVDMTSRVKEE